MLHIVYILSSYLSLLEYIWYVSEVVMGYILGIGDYSEKKEKIFRTQIFLLNHDSKAFHLVVIIIFERRGG